MNILACAFVSLGISPSFKHSWEATELVKTTRFDKSLLSFIVFLFLPPLKINSKKRATVSSCKDASCRLSVNMRRRIWALSHWPICGERQKTRQEREDCPSEPACNPQAGSSKANRLRGTRLMHRYTYMPCTRSFRQRQLVTLLAEICIVANPEGMLIMNTQPGTGDWEKNRAQYPAFVCQILVHKPD